MPTRTSSSASTSNRQRGLLSARRPLAALLCAALLAAALPPRAAFAQGQVNLPALGDAAAEGFGVGAEKRLGDQIMRDIRRDPLYIDDPILEDYLQSLWQPLVEAARRNGNITPDENDRFAWEAFLVRDRSVNAFALPGGYVGVHLGLIAMTSERDELASVLAHELSHVTQRHIARSIANSQRQSMLGIAAMILGLIAAGRANSADAANAMIVGGQAAAMQGQLNFSRDMEREADRIGFNVLSDAGFATAGMASMFEKLDGANRINDGNNYPYLRSHPLTTERIGEARSRLGVAGAGPRGASTGSLLEHAVMQARSRALMDTRVDALRRLQEQDRSAGESTTVAGRLLAWCASAMASSQLRDADRAEAAIQQAQDLLRREAAGDQRAIAAVQLVHAQLLLDRGDVRRAAELLRGFEDDRSRKVAVMRAQVALAPGNDDTALVRRSTDELQTRVVVAPMDAVAWGLLGRLQERLGQTVRSLRSQAEAQYALGDLSGAVDRLRAGRLAAQQGGSNDVVEASVIEARLRDIQEQRRQLAAELRGQRGGGGDVP